MDRRRFITALGALGSAGGLSAPVGATASSGAWTASYDDGGTEFGKAGARTTNGYVIAGETWNEEENTTESVWVARFDDTGRRQTAKTLDRDGSPRVAELVHTGDGGVALAGVDSDITSSNPWVLKFAPDFSVEWEWTVSPDVERDLGGIARAADGEILVASTIDDWGDTGASATLLTSDGRERWTKSFEAKSDGTAFRDVLADGSGFLVVGEDHREMSDGRAWLYAVDTDGTKRWERTVRVTVDGDPILKAFTVTGAADGYVVGTWVGRDDGVTPTLLRTDPSGEPRWVTPTTATGTVTDIAVVDSGFVFGGNYPLKNSRYDRWLSFVSTDGSDVETKEYESGGTVGALVGEGEYVGRIGTKNDNGFVERRRLDGVATFDRTPASTTTSTPTATSTPATETTASSISTSTAERTTAERTTTERTVGEATSSSGTRSDSRDTSSNAGGVPGFGAWTTLVAVGGVLAAVLRRRPTE